jgi:hypothetical protein
MKKLDDKRPMALVDRTTRNAPLTPRRGRFGVQVPAEPGWQRSYRLDTENLGRTPGRGMPQIWDNNDPSLRYQHHDISTKKRKKRVPGLPLGMRDDEA